MSQRPFTLVRTGDQWLRATHAQTALDVAFGEISLGWSLAAADEAIAGSAEYGTGLAFDSSCRLYRSVPEQGQIERWLWAVAKAGSGIPMPDPTTWFEIQSTVDYGDFAPAGGSGGMPGSASFVPGPLAIDGNDRLFIGDRGSRKIWVFDLWGPSLLRSFSVATPASPKQFLHDLATDGRFVWAILSEPNLLLRFTARSGPTDVTNLAYSGAFAKWIQSPRRLAVSSCGDLVVLDQQAETTIVPLSAPTQAFVVEGATDICFDSDGSLVVARQPGQGFRRFKWVSGALQEEAPLRAPHYDGLGIELAPDGRIAYFDGSKIRHAFATQVVYERGGLVTTFQLDSGNYRNVWGRLFLDACIPQSTEVRIHTFTTDEIPPGELLPWNLPDNISQVEIRSPQLTPMLLPKEVSPTAGQVPDDDDWADVFSPLHRREVGREIPFAGQPERNFATFEAPVLTEGRYLWVTLALRGNTRKTPRIRSLRVEKSAHTLVRSLPRTYVRDPDAASFLLRYLAIADGVLSGMDARSSKRERLLHPQGAPEEALAWLASFVGLTLDERWPADRRRRLLDEIVVLWRSRGTLGGLTRMIEICTDRPTYVLEHFRLRGLGAPILGYTGDDAPSASVLGSGFRVGGVVGATEEVVLTGDAAEVFRSRAHRFSVFLAASLTDEERASVLDLIEAHKPAHTLFDVCTVDAGMRAGVGLLLGVTSVVGKTGGFVTGKVGSWVLGRGTIVGKPVEEGFVVGQSTLGDSSKAANRFQ